MHRIKISLALSWLLITTCTRGNAAPSQYHLTLDPQAVAVAKAAFAAMGGAQAVAAYQDSVASGSITIYAAGGQNTYPISSKSKGLRETRVELQLPTGTNVRVANLGRAAILSPDGSIRNLYSNNTFYEHVDHVPILSVLAEYQLGKVNLLYQGVQQVQGQFDSVIEIDFVPNLDPVQGVLFASMSKTLFFVNQTTGLVDKTQQSQFYEGDQNNSVTEEVYFSDYRSVNGMLIPFRQTLFTDGQLDADLTFTSVTLNVGLPDSDFALPPAR
jgi:hypothetical protein